MPSLESAAFTILVPAGCSQDPADRLGLATMTCEMSLRGSGPRDSRQFIEDLENLGVERGENVSASHTSYSGATLASNLPAALSIYADLLLRPHLPDDQLEPARLICAAGTAGDRGRARPQGDARTATAAISRTLGPPQRGRVASPGGDHTVGRAPLLRNSCTGPTARSSASRATSIGRCCKTWSAICWATGSRASSVRHSTGQRGPKTEHLTHESNQTQIGIAYDSVPYQHPDYFRPRAPSACSAAA